jgi:flagellar hook assembly protein FlgD
VTFRLSLPAETNVRLAMFDAMGRRVRVLANGAQPAGDRTLRWDGTDDAGHAAPSGLYFARFDGAGRTMVRRLVIER